MSGFNARLGLTVGDRIAVIDAAGNVTGPTITATTQFSGPGTGLTGTALGLTAGSVSTNANLTGDVTSVGNATTLSATVVMGKLLSGYALGTNAVLAATDSIVQAFGKLQAQVSAAATAAATLQTITLTGDVTGSGTGSFATTLANSGVTAGTYNNVATTVTPFTVDSKGRITGVGAAVTIAPLWSSIGSKPTTLAGFGITDAVNSSLVGAANGLATLDSGGKVPLAQLPTSVTGSLNYQGTWNASTNSPALASGVGTKGYYYKVSTPGTTSIDGNANWTAGDLIIFDGTTWDQVQGGSEAVLSVAGKTGAVTLAVADVSGAAPLSSPALTGTPTAPTMTSTDNSTSVATTAFVKSQNYITSSGAPVQSVNGSTGAVVLTTTNITEGSNLYFTAGRAIASPLTGLSAASGGALAATDTIVAAFGKLENRMALNDAKVSYPGAPSWSQVTSKPTTLAGYSVTATDVTAQLLTGFSATAGGVVAATDSILAGLQKHEYRIAALNTTVGGLVTGVSSVNSLTGAVTLTTANVGENTNLYFTSARAIAAPLTGFSATAGGAIAATDSILQGLQKHEYRLANLVTGVSSVNSLTGAVTLTTANVAENTNLYYTQARFDTAFAAKTTANLTENTNLYFTNARAIAAPLTGLSTATGGTVAATDSILVAIGKHENRMAINDAKVSYPGGTKVDSFNTRTGAVTLSSADVTGAIGFTPANAASVGAANGIASLGSDGKVPTAQLPAGIAGSMVYMGTWNASTNSPALASGVGTKGYYYKVATAGSTSIDGINNWTVGDMIAFNGSTWDQIQGGTSDVSSVFGRVGAVTLQSSDVTTALGFTPVPTTGTGASGTWSINISGSAAAIGGYTADLQTTTASGDYILVRNQATTRIQLATPAAVAAIAQSGASGSWGISVTGSAGSVAWTNVSGRPTNVSSFSNDMGYITSAGTAAAAGVTNSLGVMAAETARSVNATGIYSFNVHNASIGDSTPVTYWSVLGFGRGAGGTGELAVEWTSGGSNIWFRSLRDTVDNWWTWKQIIHSGNIGSQSVAYASNAGTLGGMTYQGAGTAPGGNQILRSDSNGYIFAGWINTVSGDNGTATPTRIFASNDGYLRYYTPANFAAVMAANLTRTGTSDANFVTTPPNYTGDLNGIAGNPGVYFTEYAGTTNTPTGGAGSILQMADSGGNDVRYQIFNSSDGNNLYSRLMWGNGAWKPWRQVLTDLFPASANSGGGVWYAGSAAWGGNGGAASGAVAVTGFTYTGGTGSQLFTLSSGPGQCSMQMDGSLWVGDSIGWAPIGAVCSSNGCITAGNSISSGGTMYAANGFQSNNIGGTGTASYHPGGVYSAGTNWLYGQIITNNNAVNAGSGTGTFGAVNASGWVTAAHVRPIGYVYCDQQYGSGMVGVYDSTKIRMIYAMGDSYKSAADGSSTGTLYGLAFTHDNAGGQAKAGLGHQMLLCMNGVTNTAIGAGVWTLGNVMATGDVIAYYSDERLKTDIVTITDPIAKVRAMRGVTFRPNEVAREVGYTDMSEQVGVIAQDVQKVLPQLIAPAPFDLGDGGGSKSGNNYITVKYERLTAVLIEAVKEQQNQIEAQKATIEAQQLQINEILALLRK